MPLNLQQREGDVSFMHWFRTVPAVKLISSSQLPVCDLLEPVLLTGFISSPTGARQNQAMLVGTGKVSSLLHLHCLPTATVEDKNVFKPTVVRNSEQLLPPVPTSSDGALSPFWVLPFSLAMFSLPLRNHIVWVFPSIQVC